MTDPQRNLEGLSSLISFAGFAIPARARFVAHFVGSTLFSSITCGLVAGQTGAVLLPCGPLIPFMTGSWIGYTWGSIVFWKKSRQTTLTCARRYPKVLAHVLTTEFNIEIPKYVAIDNEQNETKQSLDEWIVAGGFQRKSFAILAAQSCEEDIMEMQKNETQKIINEYSNMGK